MPAKLSKIEVALRWIATIPVAVLGAILVSWIVTLVGNFGLAGYGGLDPQSWAFRVISEWGRGVICGALLVWIAARIAPTHKMGVCVIASGVTLFVSGFAAFPALIARDWIAIISVIAATGGACAMAFSVYRGEVQV